MHISRAIGSLTSHHLQFGKFRAVMIWRLFYQLGRCWSFDLRARQPPYSVRPIPSHFPARWLFDLSCTSRQKS